MLGSRVKYDEGNMEWFIGVLIGFKVCGMVLLVVGVVIVVVLVWLLNFEL